MKKLIHSKAFIVITVLIVIIGILAGLFIYQTRYGVKGMDTTMWISKIEQESLDWCINSHSGTGDDGYAYFRTEDRFPSDNAEDYRKIYVFADFENKSFLDYNYVGCYMEYMGKESMICYALPFGGDGEYMKTREITEGIGLFMCVMYCPGMDDEEIAEHLKEYKLTLYMSNKLIKNVKYSYDMSEHAAVTTPYNPYYVEE